ncbi:helix-turn-helix domain-containing protein [Noviherbaspirillum sp.]|jgi:transcriptional regulator GlxA family with amidase domain|uniref:GlxA family transcriptional regulator n=1 Tax=Noviherbaspirillum sp. TaxID=1926288 RepID=UPI0026013EBC|nr:helix-turn-helix domain-containing protein [Noviherbaspirillum sp.]
MKSLDSSAGRLHVKLLWLPDAMHGTLLHARDVLKTASMIYRLQHPKQPSPVSWQIVSPDGNPVKLPGVPCEEPRDETDQPRPEQTLMLVPAIHCHNNPHLGEITDANPQALEMLHQHATAGGWVATVFTGLAFAARLGLLSGERICAPWAFQSWFARTYPGLDFSGTDRVAMHRKVFVSVAIDAQTDMMLAILDHLLDTDLAQACANLLCYQHERQASIRDISRKNWSQKTSDSPVYRATQWLSTHIDEPYRLAALAEAAATSERTLLRHFQEVTGMSPLDYLHKLRVERAKMLLEVTLQTVHTIALACGYSDAASFRRLFRAETGMTPHAYRARFALRSRRVHWKVEDVD